MRYSVERYTAPLPFYRTSTSRVKAVPKAGRSPAEGSRRRRKGEPPAEGAPKAVPKAGAKPPFSFDNDSPESRVFPNICSFFGEITLL